MRRSLLALAVALVLPLAACTPTEQADGDHVLRVLAEWCARG